MANLFSVPAFFILFRETLECAIILSVLLALLHRLIPAEHAAFRKRLTRQVWVGVALGLLVGLIIGAVFIVVFYTIKTDLWERAEAIWEGVFALLASIVITFMAVTMLRMERAKEKWEKKLRAAAEASVEQATSTDGAKAGKFTSRYALAILAFTVVVREALESVVFIGGIGFDGEWVSIPIPAITGIIAGLLVGLILYRTGSHVAIKAFLFATTILLLLIAAGLLVKAVHEFEELTESENMLWKLNCCNHKESGWSILNVLIGWRNEATVGTLTAWIMYWPFAAAVYGLLMWNDRRKDRKEKAQVEQAGTLGKDSNIVV